MRIRLEIDHDPVTGPAEPVSKFGIGVERSELPVTVFDVKHRQPRLVFWIEPPGCNTVQSACRCLFAILAIDLQQNRNGRLRPFRSKTKSAPAQHLRESGTDNRNPPWPEAGNLLKPPIVGGSFQTLQAFDVRFIDDTFGKFRPHAWHFAENGFGIVRSPQALQLKPRSRFYHLDDCSADERTNPRESRQSLKSLALQKETEILRLLFYSIRRFAISVYAIRIGALLLE